MKNIKPSCCFPGYITNEVADKPTRRIDNSPMQLKLPKNQVAIGQLAAISGKVADIISQLATTWWLHNSAPLVIKSLKQLVELPHEWVPIV